jgi:hypothetical protein
VEWSPALTRLLASSYTRGAVSGLGLINLWVALAELADMFGSSPPEKGPAGTGQE